MNGTVDALAVASNGDIVAAGSFTSIGGVAASRIARWNGSVWSPLGAGLPGPLFSLAVMPNGDIVAGGTFFDGTLSSIARWNGTTWLPLGTGTGGSVNALLVLPSGDLVAGGGFSFPAAGGAQALRVARWNGTTWFPYGAGLGGGDVRSLAFSPQIGSGGTLFAGGYFTSSGGFSVFGVARWGGFSWGSVGNAFHPSDSVLAVASNGDLLAGGAFEFPFRGAITRWNGTTWTNLASPGFNGRVRTLSPFPNGSVLAGGDFTRFNGVGSGYSAIVGSDFRPVITAQPRATQSVSYGQPASLTVGATAPSGAVLTYRWRQGGVPISTVSNPSAATATLVLSNVTSASSYDVVVSTTASPGCTAHSQSAMILVNRCGPSDVAGANQAVGFDGVLTADDVIVYLGWFFSGVVQADVGGPNQSTSPDADLTADDIIVFLGRFFAGC